MALKARVTTLDGIDEELAKLYRKSDAGGYVLDVDETDGWALEQVAGLRSTRDDWKRKYQGLRDRFGDLDPDEAKKAMKTLKDLEAELEAEKDKEGGGDDDKKVSDPRINTLMQQVKTLQEQLTKEQDARKEERTRSVASKKRAWGTEALAAHTEDVSVLLPHLLDRMVEEKGTDGDAVFYPRGDDGELVRVAKDGSTDPKVILKEYVATKMRPEFPRNFPGTKASGGGMVTSDVSSDSDGKKHIKSSDMDAIGANIDGIASGKVIVDD